MTTALSEVRALFILKRRPDYSTDIPNFKSPSVASGMFNSATFVSSMLEEMGAATKVVIVIDNNCIDREVHQFKPTHVFIEGFWVVPEKFDVLKKLHPSVKWAVRCHSEFPFLSNEGVAMGWTFEYLKRGVLVSANSPRMNNDFRDLAEDGHRDLIPLLPNYYPTEDFSTRDVQLDDEFIDIGCFGAFRPMKNHVVQAAAAVEFAEKKGKRLRFHVNAGRVEMQGANPLKNLKNLFKNLPDHELVEHGWASHEAFLHLLSQIDMSMQVSFSETFNIVTADAVRMGTPVITSSEVPFVYPLYAEPTSKSSILKGLERAWKHRRVLAKEHKGRLESYNEVSKIFWNEFLTEHPLTNSSRKDLEKRLLAPASWKRPFYLLKLAVKTWLRGD